MLTPKPGRAVNKAMPPPESLTEDPNELVRLGVAAAREEKYDRGLYFLAEAYRRFTRSPDAKVPPAALSYYGLCLALTGGRAREAAEFCQLAIEREFFNPEHYLNLSKIWTAGRARKKALDAVDRGLTVDPKNASLRRHREALGVRKAPVLSFLGRNNPVNVSLGRLRHKLSNRKTAS